MQGQGKTDRVGKEEEVEEEEEEDHGLRRKEGAAGHLGLGGWVE